MSGYKSNRWLLWLATFVTLLCLAMTGFALWYTLTNQNRINREFIEIKKQLETYNIPEQEKITPTEANYILAVAKYCEANNGCRGKTGAQGIPGLQGIMGVQGTLGAQGLQGPQGEPGLQGQPGQDGQNGLNGENGRNVERQCNAERRRMEWRLEGEETWKVEYNLSPGQLCQKE